MTGNLLFDRLLAAERPFDPAIETDSRRYAYADLDRESARLANALVALGVQPGDRVAVQVEKSATNLLLYLATVRAGAVYLPLNTAYTLAELAYFIGDAEPALVVCDPAARAGRRRAWPAPPGSRPWMRRGEEPRRACRGRAGHLRHPSPRRR